MEKQQQQADISAIARVIKDKGVLPPEMKPKDAQQSVATLKNFPSQYWRAINPQNIMEAINSNSCTIGTFRKHEGETAARAAMVYMITDTLDDFNINQNMNAAQIAYAADTIIRYFYYLNIEDFKLCFTYAKLGVYGTVYGRIDLQVLYGWVRQYDKDRCQEAEAMSQAEAKAIEIPAITSKPIGR